MKPQEQAYFKGPVKLLQSQLEHIAQIAVFQRRQKDRTVAFFKHKSLELERRLKEVSPGQFQSSSSYRLSRPVAVTPPVTPRLRICTVRHPGSGEPMETFRDGRSHGLITPGSISSLSSPHDPAPRTPTNLLNTPHRPDPLTPNFFQFVPGIALHSPRPWASQYSATVSSLKVRFLQGERSGMKGLLGLLRHLSRRGSGYGQTLQLKHTGSFSTSHGRSSKKNKFN
ncbi:hypothetical protein AAFF_G00151910 [Aldrovandia affinis]|uniref:Uncharacterized protein n=1 Tax=Aldrovandia affinis TaxID=143900 RepID=A0AAD7W817_9TELE|nr:hypothetical protein AAFF_G00151910 [Aldrovandia affinis]